MNDHHFFKFQIDGGFPPLGGAIEIQPTDDFDSGLLRSLTSSVELGPIVVELRRNDRGAEGDARICSLAKNHVDDVARRLATWLASVGFQLEDWTIRQLEIRLIPRPIPDGGVVVGAIGASAGVATCHASAVVGLAPLQRNELEQAFAQPPPTLNPEARARILSAYDLFRAALQSEEPLARFAHLWGALALLAPRRSDGKVGQESIDGVIASYGHPQIHPAYGRRGNETLFSHLRNELAHPETRVVVGRTWAAILEDVRVCNADFYRVVARALRDFEMKGGHLI